MDGYFFNDELLQNLHKALETTIRGMTAQMGIHENTWRGWLKAKDVPLPSFIRLCNALCIPAGHFICAGEKKDVLIGKRHYVEKESKFHTIRFLNRDFGNMVTAVQGRKVVEFCGLVGISPNSFYRCFRYKFFETSCGIGIRTFLNMCNKCKVYPMDFILSMDVKVPVLNGYARREDLNMEQMTLRNMEMMAYNTRLSNELEKERDKVARLEEEVARLRKALGIKESEPEAPQQKKKTKRKGEPHDNPVDYTAGEDHEEWIMRAAENIGTK